MKKIKKMMMLNIAILIILMILLKICTNLSISSFREFQGYWKYLTYRNKLEEIRLEESRGVERWPCYLYDAYQKTEKELREDKNIFVVKARNTKFWGKVAIFIKWLLKIAVQIFFYFEIIEDIVWVLRNIYRCIKKIIRRRRR